MVTRIVRLLSLAGILVFALNDRVQMQSDARFLEPTESLSGNTGLWKVHSPDNLAREQVSFSAWYDRINRNPGHLTISTMGFGGNYGITDWLEFGANFEVNRRILVRNASELSLGQQQLGLFGTQVPGATRTAAELLPTSTLLAQLRSPVHPTVTSSANPEQAEAGEMIQLTAQGSSATGAPLTYSWTTTAGTIEGAGPEVQLDTTGLAPGSYVATVRVRERPGLFADSSNRFAIIEPVLLPPALTCSVNPSSVQVGEAVTLTGNGASPQDRPLTYEWSASGGQIVGTGATVRLDTTGASPGTITVLGTVFDDRGLSADCSVSITTVAPPPPLPPPDTVRLDSCEFGNNDGRVDNVCKAKLDTVALRLQSEPDASLAIVGFAATSEQDTQQLSQTRADNVRSYLVNEKGLAAGRLVSRTGAPGTGDASRKADLHLVPRGATFTGYNLLLDRQRGGSVETADQSSAPPASRRAGTRRNERVIVSIRPGRSVQPGTPDVGRSIIASVR